MPFFYDRETELARLQALAEGLSQGKPENLALIGVRKIGKTLLLFRFQELLEGNERLVLAYTYVEPGSFRDFSLAALLALLSQTALHFQAIERLNLLGLDPAEKLQALAQALLPLFPRLANKWLELPLLAGKDPEVIFDFVFELAEGLGEEQDLYYLLVFDEFQNVRTFRSTQGRPFRSAQGRPFGAPALEHRLRQYLLRQKRLAVIVAGSSISAIEDMFRNRQNPLFGHFKIELVRPFPFAAARGFVIEKLGGRMLLNETQLAFLAQITGGYPYYLDVITDELLARAPSLKRASDSTIADTLLSSVFASNGLIYTYLAYLIEAAFQERGRRSYLNLLRTIARGRHSVSEIAAALRLKKENVSTPLRRLVDMGFLYHSEARYFFLDPLLELWMREVYPVEEEMHILGIRERYGFFKSQVEQMIDTYKQELGKGNEARIRELFAAFDGRGALGGLRLPRFERVTTGVTDSKEYDVIAWRQGQRVWIAEVKDTAVDASMARSFANKLRALTEYQVEEKILICLAGHDSKVPALAQAENIRLWTLEDINSLLKLYGKFPIQV
jgi:AAA+ ATPase superfamily predicted ATPase